MSAIKPVTFDNHGNKRWLRYTSYHFAASDVVAPLVIMELPQAVMGMPIAFLLQEEKYYPVAVLGLDNGQNLFVDIEGHWQGRYIPAFYRSYPFRLFENADGAEVLCIDESSGLLTDTAQGEPFFTDEGRPAKGIEQVMEYLGAVSSSQKVTLRICALLQKYGLLQPWKIKVKIDTSEREVEGLHCVDETVLNGLQADALKELQSNGCFPMIYCQLLSMQHLSKMGQVFNKRTREQQPALGFSLDSETLSFDNISQNGLINLDNI